MPIRPEEELIWLGFAQAAISHPNLSAEEAATRADQLTEQFYDRFIQTDPGNPGNGAQRQQWAKRLDQ